MKRFICAMVITALEFFAVPVFARVNQAVQPLFFEHLQSALTSGQSPPSIHAGAVNEVSLADLAWAVDNLKSDPVPLVIEFYSSNTADCLLTPNSQENECDLQDDAEAAAAANYPGRVRFLRIDVSKYPILLNGPDVRALPSHIFIAAYSDTTHYTANKAMGYFDTSAIESLVKDSLRIDP